MWRRAVLLIFLACVFGARCATSQSCAGQRAQLACGKVRKCCWSGSHCVSSESDPSNCGKCGVKCPAAKPSCSASTCQACPAKTTYCASSNRCVNLAVDPSNCGKCGVKCPAAKPLCSASKCLVCPAKTIFCAASNECVVLSADPNNCGKCGVKCPVATPWCKASTCQTCPAKTTFCASSNRCVDLAADPSNCGKCGVKCPVGRPLCSASKCLVCPVKATYCAASNKCLDLSADPNNCGKCGVKCPAAKPSCSASTCQACPAKTSYCASSNRCVNLAVDPSNCGKCGVKCPAAKPLCSASKCLVCPAKTIFCAASNECVVLSADPNNCGKCGVKCPAATPLCKASTCQTCPAKTTFCASSNKCVDLAADPSNCGKCGVKCPAAKPSCSGSTCRVSGFLSPGLPISDCPPDSVEFYIRNGCPAACARDCSCWTHGPPWIYMCREKSCDNPVDGQGSVTFCTASGKCVDLSADPINCGECGVKCPAAKPLCSASKCMACPAKTTFCAASNKCVDLSGDHSNCGKCGVKCNGATPRCRNSACVNATFAGTPGITKPATLISPDGTIVLSNVTLVVSSTAEFLDCTTNSITLFPEDAVDIKVGSVLVGVISTPGSVPSMCTHILRKVSMVSRRAQNVTVQTVPAVILDVFTKAQANVDSIVDLQPNNAGRKLQQNSGGAFSFLGRTVNWNVGARPEISITPLLDMGIDNVGFQLDWDGNSLRTAVLKLTAALTFGVKLKVQAGQALSVSYDYKLTSKSTVWYTHFFVVPIWKIRIPMVYVAQPLGTVKLSTVLAREASIIVTYSTTATLNVKAGYIQGQGMVFDTKYEPFGQLKADPQSVQGCSLTVKAGLELGVRHSIGTNVWLTGLPSNFDYELAVFTTTFPLVKGEFLGLSVSIPVPNNAITANDGSPPLECQACNSQCPRAGVLVQPAVELGVQFELGGLFGAFLKKNAQQTKAYYKLEQWYPEASKHCVSLISTLWQPLVRACCGPDLVYTGGQQCLPPVYQPITLPPALAAGLTVTGWPLRSAPTVTAEDIASDNWCRRNPTLGYCRAECEALDLIATSSIRQLCPEGQKCCIPAYYACDMWMAYQRSYGEQVPYGAMYQPPSFQPVGMCLPMEQCAWGRYGYVSGVVDGANVYLDKVGGECSAYRPAAGFASISYGSDSVLACCVQTCNDNRFSSGNRTATGHQPVVASCNVSLNAMPSG